MQALILAAGMGTRLNGLTKDKPKCMVEINGVSILENSLRILSDTQKIDEVIIVVGYEAEFIIKKIKDKYQNLKITYVHNKDYNVTNNIYSLWLAKDYITKDVILLESDIFFTKELCLELFNLNNDNIFLIGKYEPYMDGTVVQINNDSKEILSVIEKSKQNHNFDYSDKYKTINIYKFSKHFVKNVFLPNLELFMKKASISKYYEEVFEIIIKAGCHKIYGKEVSNNYWFEIDDQNDLERVEDHFSSNVKKINKIKDRWGGYWNYDFVDHCFLYNLYFPPVNYYNRLKIILPNLINNYPSHSRECEKYLSRWDDDYKKEDIAIGNGASEIIKVLNRMIGKIAVPVPSFNEYGASLNKNKIYYYNLAYDNFTINPYRLIEEVKKNNCDTLLLINPNNPTSIFENNSKIKKILLELSSLKLIILDESFIDFVDSENASFKNSYHNYPNLLIIKSISKEYGIPGLRLGFSLSKNKEFTKLIKENLPIWNINSLAEDFLHNFLKYKKDYEKSIQLIKKDRQLFFSELKKIHWLKVYEPAANFIFAQFLPNINLDKFIELVFNEHKILLKSCSNKKGIENGQFIRISVRTNKENMNCINAIQKSYNSLYASRQKTQSL